MGAWIETFTIESDNDNADPTDMENKIFELIGRGLSHSQIAERLNISIEKIKKVRQTINKPDKKINVNDFNAIDKRRKKIVELRNRGMSYGEISKIVNITRQRVEQIYKSK